METPVELEGNDANQSSSAEEGNEADKRSPSSEVELECSSRKSLYQQDSQILGNLLEEEIWLLILGKVKDKPVDAENCVNATPYFRELLWKKRKEFLFPKVIDLLAVRNEERGNYNVNLEENAEDEGEDSDSDDEQEIPEGDYVVWRKTVMECRLVCHAWNKGVEKCYQKSEMLGIAEFVSDPDPRTRLKTPTINLSYHWTNRKYRTLDFQGAQKFLDHFQQTHFSAVEGRARKNPFFSRFISFEDVNTYDGGIDAYMAAITTILEMWGREIWYYYLDMHAKSDEAPQLYRQLAHWLALMPNLKYLMLYGLDRTDLMSAKFFARNPLPTLDKLEALDLRFVGTGIVNQLLSKNKHISGLKMRLIREIDEDVIRSLTNLKGLSSCDSELGDKIVEKFGAGWKLNNLFFCAWMDSMKGAHLFQYIQAKWSSSLTQLQLREPFAGEMGERLEQSKSLRLNLRCLRSLKLQIKGPLFLDFILPLGNSLEHLEIYERQVEDEPTEVHERIKREQIIDYVGFKGKMLESNIWRLFLNLKSILLQNESLYVMER